MINAVLLLKSYFNLYNPSNMIFAYMESMDAKNDRKNYTTDFAYTVGKPVEQSADFKQFPLCLPEE